MLLGNSLILVNFAFKICYVESEQCYLKGLLIFTIEAAFC